MEPKLFKIQIEKYANDINALLSKEKQEEIYDLFTNYNKLDSEEKFREVESKLHLACSDGDVDLIKIYLSETIEDYLKDLIFKIDESKRNASLLCNQSKRFTDLHFYKKTEQNDHIIMKTGKFLFGKSDVKKDEFDSLVFACLDIKEICIPSNIITAFIILLRKFAKN